MTAVPLVDLQAQYRAIKEDIDAAIARVIADTSFILGDEVTAFEEAFAEYTGAKGTVGVASGTAALMLALKACGIGSGDEVITAAHSFIASAEAISLAGATPVFVDIDPDTYTIDPGQVEGAITPRTRALMPVHLYGQPAEMDALLDIARRHGLRVVEDAAQAHGSSYKGHRIGAISDLTCFSFYPGKNLGAYGDAGAVTGNDTKLLSRIRRLRNHGRDSKYTHDEIGHGERLDALQAAILSVKLPHLEAWTEARRGHAESYRALLDGTGAGLPHAADHVRHVYHLFVVRVPDRDRVFARLREAGVGAGIHYPVPLHLQPAYAPLGYRAGSLPHTEKAAADVLSLPIFPELTDVQKARVCDALKDAMTRC